MCYKFAVLALTCLSGLAAHPVEFKQKRHIDNSELGDLEGAASEQENPLAAIHAGSKYFQYLHGPSKGYYEKRYKGSNDHHYAERQKGDRKGDVHDKVRWGDKNGGYGEHYWDLNHDGHTKDEESSEETENKPKLAAQQNQPRYITYGNQSRQESRTVPAFVPVEATQRGKREQGLLKDVEFISDKARSLILDGSSQKHGGNYRRDDDYRGKREQHVINEEDLVFESDKGTFLDRKTGIQYELKPVY